MTKPYWEIRTVRNGFVVAKNESMVTAAMNDTLHAFSSIDGLISFVRKEMKAAKNSQAKPE